MNRVFLLIIYTIIIYFNAAAQPRLKVEPSEMEFHDMFQRFQKVYFINVGNEPLYLDSLTYLNPGIYYLRYNSYQNYPILIEPGDSVAMDCILSGYYTVTANDTLDTLYIYNNGIRPVEYVKIKIDFYEHDFRPGIIKGNVSNNGLPLQNARIYFIRDGNYFIEQATSDQYGNYMAQLPPGNYITAAEKDSFYTTFFGQSLDPFNAAIITVKKDSIYNADITLYRLPPGAPSISGNVRDEISDNLLNKAIVVIRKGTHTPSKIQQDTLLFRGISAIVKDNGSYKLQGVKDPGYYFVQAFSDFYIPGYYKSGSSSPFFWQNSDSVFVSENISNVNFALTRDSSIGGGSISGSIGNSFAGSLEGVTIYAKPINQNSPYSYSISSAGGSFNVKNLPYGKYQLTAQQIGKNNSYSDTLQINPANINVTGITLNFTTSIEESNYEPSAFMLEQNYPNPFNPATSIRFTLEKKEYVRLKVFNLLGQLVSVIAESELNPGVYTFQFQPETTLSSGIYIYILQSGNKSAARKMIYLK